MSTLHGKTRYERSALPAADQLDDHERDRQQHEVATEPRPESLRHGGKAARRAEAELRQRAARVDEVDRHNAPAKTAQ